MMKNILMPYAPFLAVLLLLSFTLSKEPTQWKIVPAQNEPDKRHENAFVRVGDSFYLVGGRNIKPVEAYNIKTRQWKKMATPPLEMHHFQAIEYKGEIYVMGAFTGKFPHETPIPRIQIYNPKTDTWREGAEIPENRRRGAAGVTLYKDKIYLVCGIIDGHYDGHVTWLDEYDPKTDKWRQLPDAPHARDHFQAAVVNDQLFVAGGRRSTHKTGHVLDLTIAEVDIFDFKTNTWKTLPANLNLPTQRAGTASIALANQILVIGGESPQKLAHNQTEAFDLKTNTWKTLAPLQTGRHGTQAILYQNKVFIAAGSANQGGGPELNTMEVLE
jgi:N-acetylneuraminic acid mutarotase